MLTLTYWTPTLQSSDCINHSEEYRLNWIPLSPIIIIIIIIITIIIIIIIIYPMTSKSLDVNSMKNIVKNQTL